MVAPGYTNLSVTVETREAVRLLTVHVSAILGRRVSQSDALRIAARIALTQQERIIPVARELDI